MISYKYEKAIYNYEQKQADNRGRVIIRIMKYLYLFVLFTGIAIRLQGGVESELNDEQGTQIDCLIITSQYEEKGVANKANGLKANTPYCIIRLCYEVTPMTVNNQFVKLVRKYGIPGKESEYDDDNESKSLVRHSKTK